MLSSRDGENSLGLNGIKNNRIELPSLRGNANDPELGNQKGAYDSSQAIKERIFVRSCTSPGEIRFYDKPRKVSLCKLLWNGRF